MSKLISFGVALLAMALASCEKTPAELCNAPETLDKVRSIILDRAAAYQGAGGEQVNLKDPKLRQALELKLIALGGFDKQTKKVDCTAHLSLSMEATLKKIAAEMPGIDELPGEADDLIHGGNSEIRFSRQATADNKDYIVTVDSVEGPAVAAYLVARLFKAFKEGVAEGVAASAAAEEGTPTAADLNAGATSEYDLVGVSPISECNSPQVQAEIESEMRSVTGQPPGVLTDAKWWNITGITTTGPSTNGHQCHAFINMGSPDGEKQTAPLNYVTRYEDGRLTVDKTPGEFR